MGHRVDEISKTSHTVEGAGAVEDIDVEEGDESETELTTILCHIPLLDVEDIFNAVKVDNLFEEVKGAVAERGVGKVGNGGGSWPGDDTDENDAGDDGAFDAVHHEDDGKDTAAKYANPHGRIAHLVPVGTRAVGQTVLGRAASQLNRGGGSTNDNADALAVGEANEGEEETNADTGGDLDGVGDGAGEPLAHTEDGETKKDETLDEDGG